MKSYFWLVAVLGSLQVHAAPPTSLCHADEQTVFSCQAKAKTASVCAANELMSGNGRLIYRFGRSMETVELEYSNAPNSLREKFSLRVETWAKGTSITLSFKRGAYEYGVYHAHGVYGVDGGPNRAGVGVRQGAKDIANIICDEESTVDKMYESLNSIGLPTGPEF